MQSDHSICSFSSVQFSRSVVSDSLRPHEPQHARPPCSSPTPGVHPNPCPSSRLCHLTISSSVVPFSSCPLSFPASVSFQMSQIFISGGQNIGFSFNIISSVQFSLSVVSDSFQPHESQHAKPPCPSPTPGVHLDSRPSSQWCHPAISSSVIPFSSCPQSSPASGSFPMNQLFASGGHSIGVSASTSVLPMNTQYWSPLGWACWISLQSKGLSRVLLGKPGQMVMLASCLQTSSLPSILFEFYGYL